MFVRTALRRGLRQPILHFGVLFAVAQASPQNPPPADAANPQQPAAAETAGQPEQPANPGQPQTPQDEEALKHIQEQLPGPRAMFPALEHDFGTVWVGATLEHVFEIRNTGELPLELISVQPSCGCTVAKDYDTTIAAGGSGRLPVVMDTRRLQGPFLKTVKVSTNDMTNRIVTLTVKGHVKQYVEVEPRVVNFVTVKPNEEKTQVVKITNNSSQPLQAVLERNQFGKSFTAELVEKTPGSEYELIVRSRPPYREGRNNANIQFKTNIPEQPQVNIQAMATVLSRLDIKPAQLLLPTRREGDYSETIMLTNHGGTPVHVLSATGEEGVGIKVEEMEPGTKYAIHINFPAGFQPSSQNSRIVVKTDDAEKPEIEIAVRSPIQMRQTAEQTVGTPAPALELTAESGQRYQTAAPGGPLVLAFYASWCPQSRKSLIEVEKVYQEYKEKGVSFVAMNQDDPNAMRQEQRYSPQASVDQLRALEVTFDIVLDPTRQYGEEFLATSFPTFIVIDAAGTIAKVYSGALLGTRINQFREDLDALLQNQAASEATSAAGSGS